MLKSKNKIMENNNPNEKKDIRNYVISYFTLRKAVGILGLSLPIILVIGSVALDGKNEILNSISTYYHTHMESSVLFK